MQAYYEASSYFLAPQICQSFHGKRGRAIESENLQVIVIPKIAVMKSFFGNKNNSVASSY